MKTLLISIAMGTLAAGSNLLAGGTCGADKNKNAEACGAGGSCGATTAVTTVAAPATYGEIDTAGLRALLNAGTPAVILDARTGQWDDGRRIQGAKALAPDATAEQAATVIPARNSLVITYCVGTKCPASKKLAENLLKLGYTNVVKYPDGIDGWTAAGNQAEATK